MKHFCCLLFLASTCTGFQTNTPGTENILSCSLSSNRSVYKKGEIPILTIRIYNQSKNEIYLMGALDGSESQFRYPYVYFTINRPGDNKSKTHSCKTTNPLRRNDFVKIAPGKTFDPYMKIDEAGFFNSHLMADSSIFTTPGLYKIRFHYSTHSNKLEDYFGISKTNTDSIFLQSLFTMVPKVELLSNEIVFRIAK